MNKTLLVIDMQNDFVSGSLGSPQAKGIIQNVKEKIGQYKENGGTIIYTRDTHDTDYLKTQEGRMLPVEHCIIDTKGWEIINEIDITDAEIWDKKSFGSPEMADYLKTASDADEIELIGLCTDICVVSNALLLKAFLPEVKITVDAKCCAGVTEESHKAALLTMKMCHVNIING